ncbi:MAG: ATP-binding protein, partial [Armatimonadota bacterium]
QVAFLVPITSGVLPVDWNGATETDLAPSDLDVEPIQQAAFAELPPVAAKSKSYEAWGKDLARWLLQSQKLELLRSPRSGRVSNPGETERDFRIRLQDLARETRDATTERLRQKYAPKVAALQDRIRRAEQAVQREQEQAQQEKVQTAVSIGTTLLGALMGRKTFTVGTLGRATTAARGASRAYRQAQDVGRAQETVQALQAQLQELEAQLRAEVDALEGTGDPFSEPLETVVVKSKRTGVAVRAVGLAWTLR